MQNHANPLERVTTSARPRRLKRTLALLAVGLCALCVSAAPAADPHKSRVLVYLESANEVINDLEWAVVQLAGEKEQYETNILPNIDIFLPGVEVTRPIRFDAMLGGEEGYRLQPSIPLHSVAVFIEQNIEPIGIEARQARGQRDYYELTGETYSGAMRIVDGYAAIAKEGHESDIPADMPSPETLHDFLARAGYDAAIALGPATGTAAVRQVHFDDYRKRRLEQVQKIPDETQEEFHLREVLVENQLDRLERLFVNSDQLLMAWDTDVPRQVGRGILFLDPAEKTALYERIQRIGTRPSYFARIPSSDDPTLTGRISLPQSDFRREQLRRFYAASRPVTLANIDDPDEQSTEAEKAARREIVNIAYDMLEAALQQDFVDSFMEIQRAGSGHQQLVFGVTAADGTRATEVVKKLPEAYEGFTVKEAVAEVDGVAVHEVVPDKWTENLQDFFGPDNRVYVGTGEEAFYLAMGPGALDALQQAIRMSGAEGAEPTDDLLHVRFHATPLLEFLHRLMLNKNFSFIRFFQERSQSEEPGIVAENVEGDRQLNVENPVEWREVALRVLQAAQRPEGDLVTGYIRRDGENIVGETVFGVDLMRVAGKLVAKFAKENLQ